MTTPGRPLSGVLPLDACDVTERRCDVTGPHSVAAGLRGDGPRSGHPVTPSRAGGKRRLPLGVSPGQLVKPSGREAPGLELGRGRAPGVQVAVTPPLRVPTARFAR